MSNTTATPAQDWMTTACQSLVVVAETALALPIAAFAPAVVPRESVLGAFVPIMQPQEAMQIGIVADAASGRELARALLQEASADVLSATDVADAIGEIANMVAGATKAAMAAASGVIALGLPMVIHGEVAASHFATLECARTQIGTATVTLVVVRAPQTQGIQSP